MGSLRHLSSGLAVAAIVVAGAAAPAQAETCTKQKGRTIVKDANWRVFDRSKKGVRRYEGTVRHSIRACRRGTVSNKQVAAWTDSNEDRTRVEHSRIVGDWVALAGQYRTGVAEGTYVQVVHLPVPSRTRIEGPLADRIAALHLSAAGSIAVETLAAGIPALDVYDRAGRRTLAMGDFSEVWIGGDTVYWRDSQAIRSETLDGPAANDVEAYASL